MQPGHVAEPVLRELVGLAGDDRLPAGHGALGEVVHVRGHAAGHVAAHVRRVAQQHDGRCVARSAVRVRTQPCVWASCAARPSTGRSSTASVYPLMEVAKTSAGRSRAIRARAFCRHVTHSPYPRLRIELYGSMSGAGHPDFVSDTNRQCCCSASCSNGGNQVAACESPSSTTVVRLVVSPNTQPVVEVSGSVRWRPVAVQHGQVVPGVLGCRCDRCRRGLQRRRARPWGAAGRRGARRRGRQHPGAERGSGRHLRRRGAPAQRQPGAHDERGAHQPHEQRPAAGARRAGASAGTGSRRGAGSAPPGRTPRPPPRRRRPG